MGFLPSDAKIKLPTSALNVKKQILADISPSDLFKLSNMSIFMSLNNQEFDRLLFASNFLFKYIKIKSARFGFIKGIVGHFGS